MTFYFYGANSYLRKAAIADIRQKYIKKYNDDLSISTFDMEEARLAELIDAVSAGSLFAKSRIVIVKNLSSNQTAKEKIDDLLSIVPDSTILIIEDEQPDLGSTYFKKISSKSKAKKFDLLSRGELEKWVKNQFLIEKLEIDTSIARYLIQKIGEDIWQLKNEIDKLVSSGSEVTRKQIDKLVVSNITQSIFNLTDAVAKKDLKNALKIYQNLNMQNVSDQQILAMLNWQYRNLALANDNLGKTNQWMKDFMISNFVVEKSTKLLQNLHSSEIKIAYQAIVDADLAIKTGQKPSQRAMEELLIKLSK